MRLVRRKKRIIVSSCCEVVLVERLFARHDWVHRG